MWSHVASAPRAAKERAGYKLLTRLETGDGKPEDIDLMDRICTNMMGNTVCVLADAATMPTQSFLRSFAMNLLHISLRAAVPSRRTALWCISMRRRKVMSNED
jgi:hypothetical protein